MPERSKSKYAQKKERGNQMYGPGCCAHTVSASQVDSCKLAAVRANWRLRAEYEDARREDIYN